MPKMPWVVGEPFMSIHNVSTANLNSFAIVENHFTHGKFKYDNKTLFEMYPQNPLSYSNLTSHIAIVRKHR